MSTEISRRQFLQFVGAEIVDRGLNGLKKDPRVRAAGSFLKPDEMRAKIPATINHREEPQAEATPPAETVPDPEVKDTPLLRQVKHENVRGTTFWAGEKPNKDNSNISNEPSAFYSDWPAHFGGVDTPDARNPENIYHPEGVTPLENPFYVAIPLSEFDENGRIKEIEPLLTDLGFVGEGNIESYLKNQWVRVDHQGRVVYAQVADTGPFPDERGETDMDYIANGAPYSGTEEYGIGGIDMSPAVTLFLTGHESTDEITINVGQTTLESVTWQLVAEDQVPDGPWKETVTQSPPNWE